jgi:hypothetical protein
MEMARLNSSNTEGCDAQSIAVTRCQTREESVRHVLKKASVVLESRPCRDIGPHLVGRYSERKESADKISNV